MTFTYTSWRYSIIQRNGTCESPCGISWCFRDCTKTLRHLHLCTVKILKKRMQEIKRRHFSIKPGWIFLPWICQRYGGMASIHNVPTAYFGVCVLSYNCWLKPATQQFHWQCLILPLEETANNCYLWISVTVTSQNSFHIFPLLCFLQAKKKILVYLIFSLMKAFSLLWSFWLPFFIFLFYYNLLNVAWAESYTEV